MTGFSLGADVLVPDWAVRAVGDQVEIAIAIPIDQVDLAAPAGSGASGGKVEKTAGQVPQRFVSGASSTSRPFLRCRRNRQR